MCRCESVSDGPAYTVEQMLDVVVLQVKTNDLFGQVVNPLLFAQTLEKCFLGLAPSSGLGRRCTHRLQRHDLRIGAGIFG